MKELLKKAEQVAGELHEIENQLYKHIGTCRAYIDYKSPAELPRVRIHGNRRELIRITFDEARELFSWLRELGIIEEVK